MELRNLSAATRCTSSVPLLSRFSSRPWTQPRGLLGPSHRPPKAALAPSSHRRFISSDNPDTITRRGLLSNNYDLAADLPRKQQPSSALDMLRTFNIPRSPAPSINYPASTIRDPDLKRSFGKKKKPVVSLKLDSSLGRTVYIDSTRGMDFNKAVRIMETNCARNSLRRDFSKQRFHERPGIKRKRLKSERWRKGFKVAFKATVQKVKMMKKQGW
ncbi:MAG: hypothetical protein M1829_006695 [Trizodia sp. TS-e1964]|nr:MAG: hypothetical protein M1829_006695 [Trizodia sp. TS-e1964]